MSIDLDKYLGGHARALSLGNQRLNVLAANVANADTPNYKARDIDFNAAMQSVKDDTVQMKVTHSNHLNTGGAGGLHRANIQYRFPDQPSLDGNTVDSERENAAIAETAIRYEATLTFLNSKIRGLRLAITGGR